MLRAPPPGDHTEHALAEARSELGRANRAIAEAAARTHALLQHERRLFARHLHASVQAAVNAAALLIERQKAAGTLDGATLQRAASVIDAAIANMALTMDGDGSVPPTKTIGGIPVDGTDVARDGIRDLDRRLEAIAATWEDLAALDLDLEPCVRRRLGADAVARATLCDLLAEACANAVIRGHARHIAVTVRCRNDLPMDTPLTQRAAGVPEELRLVVVDDGTAMHPKRGDGHGSSVLTDSCASWSLEHGPEGTRLVADLPLR